MINFFEFPTELQYADGQIERMTLDDLERAFYMAGKLLLADDLKRWQQCMWSAMERVRTNSSKANMQKVLDHLEDYKRRLGRQYAVHHNMRTLLKYNEIECDIRWLVVQYELERKSKPYFLS
jgi:hypothetical protein